MKKYLYYFIVFSAGLINSYVIIVLAGIFYPMDLVVWIVQTLKKLELMYLDTFLMHLILLTILALISLPFFLLSGFLFKRFIKLDNIKKVTTSSVGIILLVGFASTIAFRTSFLNFLLDSMVLVAINAMSIVLLSKIIEEH
jgi:hypothetical protein